MIKYLTLCPRAAKWLKKTVNLPFALCSASDSQHVSVSVESRPGLPGSPGGSKRSWKHREKHPDLLCFLLLPVLCIDILPDPCVCFSCGTTHGFQKHEFICFVGWWTCLYLGQGSEKLRCSGRNPQKKSQRGRRGAPQRKRKWARKRGKNCVCCMVWTSGSRKRMEKLFLVLDRNRQVNFLFTCPFSGVGSIFLPLNSHH